jgi:hypothetical protein
MPNNERMGRKKRGRCSNEQRRTVCVKDPNIVPSDVVDHFRDGVAVEAIPPVKAKAAYSPIQAGLERS